MSSREWAAVLAENEPAVEAQPLEQLCRRLDDLAVAGGTALPANVVQRIFTAAFRLYADQALTGEVGEPFTTNGQVNATDVMVVVSTMLRQQNLEVFELGLWQSFGGQPWIKQETPR